MRVLSFEMANRLLRYDPDTGNLFWKPRTPDLFDCGGHSRDHSCSKWNTKNAGKEAFTTIRNGYKYGSIFRKKYQAHLVIWLMVNGCWPSEQIDHVNGSRSDNRFANLRVVTHAENGRNQRLPSNNSSGFVGVLWNRNAKKWQARVMRDGRTKHLGYFHEIQDAVDARQKASRELGFHPNHGSVAA